MDASSQNNNNPGGSRNPEQRGTPGSERRSDSAAKSSPGATATLLPFLVRNGRISAEDAAAAEAAIAAETGGKTVLDWLVAKGLVDEEEVARSLAAHFRLNYVNPAAASFDPNLVALVKEEVATRFLVVPLRRVDGTLVVATANPLDREALRAVEFATGLRVRIEVATLTAVRDALRHAYHLEQSLDAYLHGVKSAPDASIIPLQDDSGDLSGLAEASELPPIIKLANLILLEGVRSGASDVHIEPSAGVVQVRYRIDGLLEEGSRMPKWVSAPLIARYKVMAKLDITERRVPQDGRIGISYHNAKIDLRVSSLPTQHGEKITMRILNPTAAQGGLEKMQLSPRDQECVQRAIHRPEGIVLVTGPTGSGKSTTLYAMLNEIATTAHNIVTIENPIEYQIRGINQVEVNEKQGLTFATTLRSILRQDPDVIMVGEIRDAETAAIALRAAQTGHLVLSTLHTNDTVGAIARLADLGIEPYMLASALHLVVAQRLVRRICSECSEPMAPTPAERKLLALGGEGDYRRGRGCPRCRGTGYSGRAAVVEVLEVSSKLAKLIEKRAPESALRQQAKADGMLSLNECATGKLRRGETTAEEVLRVVDTATVGELCPKCEAPVEHGFKVCPVCLASLRRECSQCNQPLQESWKVCPFCLAPVAAEASAAAAVPASPAVAAEAEVAPPPEQEVVAPPEVVAAPAPGPLDERRPFTILVVDDAADMRHLISVSLERSDLGVRVITAEDGVDALEKAQALPDAILLDIMMPRLDGFEVCRRLRADIRTTFIPILMLTTLGDLAHREEGFLAGTDDYIAKPFNRADLVARVKRLLRRNYGDDAAPQHLAGAGVAASAA